MTYILSAARTPIGSFLGSLSALTTPQIGAVAIQRAVQQAHVDPNQINDVLMGCVLTAGVGQAPARQAMRLAGLPDSIGATTVGKVCGSGMQAIMQGRNAILAGEADVVVAGGMESMSNAPFLSTTLRQGSKMGHQQLLDAMIHDGLWDPYGNVHMGNCGERCAKKYGFTREVQDAYATETTHRSIKAQQAGIFTPEIAPVSIPQKKGDAVVVHDDEGPQKAKPDKIPSLKPAFEKDGTITAANASSINDGAAVVVLASPTYVQQHHLTPLAKIVATATHSQDPTWFTTAPVGAMQKALQKANLTVDDIGVFEINEAFAVVVMAAIHDLKLNPDKVNIYGGAIVLGHPIGASGCRIVVTLLNAMQRTNSRYGLASLCIGGGEATAMVIERLT